MVVLDDHHDSDLINRGLAADAGYRGTFGDEAEEDLDELRLTFRRKAHTAAMERALTALLRAGLDGRGRCTDGEARRTCPDGRGAPRLLRRRAALGLCSTPCALVAGRRARRGRTRPRTSPLRLRFARSVRISIDGNAHFCRGLLRTRYPGAVADQTTTSTKGTAGMSSMKAVQVVKYDQTLRADRVADPRSPAPLDVIVRIGGAGVCRTDLHILEGQWAREVRRRRCPTRSGTRTPAGSHAVGSAVTNVAGRRQGDPAPADHLRAVPGLPVRRRRALRATPRSPASTPTAAMPSISRPRRAAWSSSTTRWTRRRRGAGRRRAHRVPRGGQGGAPAAARGQVRGDRRRRARAHRRPGAQGAVGGRDDRGRPQSRRAEAGRVDSAPTTACVADGDQVEAVARPDRRQRRGGGDRLRRRGRRDEDGVAMLRRPATTTWSATARTSTSRPSTSSPPRSTSSATWSAPTTTSAS